MVRLYNLYLKANKQAEDGLEKPFRSDQKQDQDSTQFQRS